MRTPHDIGVLEALSGTLSISIDIRWLILQDKHKLFDLLINVFDGEIRCRTSPSVRRACIALPILVTFADPAAAAWAIAGSANGFGNG